MHARPSPHVVAPIVGSVILALVLVVVWAAVPEALQMPIVLVGFMATVILYGLLYSLQRRHHW
jgi:hypothetical protein